MIPDASFEVLASTPGGCQELVTDGGRPECPGCGMAYSTNDEPFCPCGRLRPAVVGRNDRLVTDGGQTPSARLRTVATDLDAIEEDLRGGDAYGRSLASVVRQLADVSRMVAGRLEDRRSDPDRFRIDDDELLTDGGTVTTGDQHLCHCCGVLHDGRGDALACCSDRFDDTELVTDGGSRPEDVTVGTRVRTLQEFSGVPEGSEGVVDEEVS